MRVSLMDKSARVVIGLAIGALSLVWVTLANAQLDNTGSIANTRHNLTQRPQAPRNQLPLVGFMDTTRNQYNEVCVYCHTPHGAADTGEGAKLPLWNRTIKPGTIYTTYNLLGTSTLTQPVTRPGPNSLACLSCHDGQTAIDSVINMPGSGGWLASQATSTTVSFLNEWTNPAPSTTPKTTTHGTMVECMICHGTSGPSIGAIDFTTFLIGTDLRNDHPVGIKFPTTGPGVDFNIPLGERPGKMKWFDNGDGFPDKREIRLYDSGTGDGYEVECASCHDPHGVPSAGPSSTFLPTFLRVSNAGSGLCLTCHVK